MSQYCIPANEPSLASKCERYGQDAGPKYESSSQAALIGWLATSIVHDLRNPLGVIRSSSEMLMEGDVNSAHMKRLATNMHSAAIRLEGLIADLVTTVRGNLAPPEVCSLRDVVNCACETALAIGRRANVQFFLDEVPPEIRLPLRRSSIQWTLVNLLVNSIQAMPNGGKVVIRARQLERQVFMDVWDSGPGIPSCIRDRLFTPFVTEGKPGGLGLGLAVGRQTVLHHGGDMWLVPGIGAHFVIRLPM